VTVNNGNITAVNFTATVQTWSISGNVSANGAGATVALSGAASATVTADSSGNYSFAGLSNGSYTVTPSKAGFTFTPTSQPVTVNNGNIAAVNFTATVQTWSISGSVSANGANATVALSGAASATATADSSGNYSFASLANGTYTVTPSMTGLTFSPTSQSVTVNNGNVTAVNFTVVVGQTWSISGNVSANGAGASVSLSGAATATVSASSGTPPALVKTCVIGNESNTASISTPSCVNNAGDFLIVTVTAVRPASMVTLTDTVGDTFINANPAVYPFHDTIQDGDVYVFYVPAAKGGSPNVFTTVPASGSSALEIHVSEWSGMQGWTPDQSAIASGSTGGTSFNSGSKTTTNSPELIFGYTFPLGNSSPGSGFTGLSNVNGDWDEYQIQSAPGSVAATFTSDNSGTWLATMVTFQPPSGYSVPGSYAFTGLPNGVYTVTPTKVGFTFNPTSQPVTVNNSNVTAVNFTATVQTWSISGNVSANGAGATVALSGAASATVTADGSGNYSFAGLANGAYTVTPSKAGFTFNPTSQPVTVNNGNIAAVNFTATVQTWSISGSVSANGANATVALSGAASATATADSSGNYSFASLANGTYTVTPSKTGFTFNPTSLPVTVSNSNVTAVNFTASPTGSTGLAIDANISADGTTAKTTVSTPAFSTSAGNELLVAFVATDYLSGTNTIVNGVAGGGLTWALVKRTNVRSGTAEIWAALASTPLANVTVTATVSQSVVSSITVLSFTGVDTTSGSGGLNAIGSTGTGNSSKAAPTASLTTTRNKSWVLGVGNDYDNAINRTPGTGQTLVHQFLTPTGDTYWVQMQTATTPLSGTTVTINDTAPSTDRYNLSIVEVRTP
jgi:hypothetical protein